jgi:hypothetical protein
VEKPHPAEQTVQSADFIKGCASIGCTGRIVLTPIGEVLAIADVLFNRGEFSGIIATPLNRKVPVIAVPAGRKTFFDGVLEAVVADDEEGIKKALELIGREGFELLRQGHVSLCRAVPG